MSIPCEPSVGQGWCLPTIDSTHVRGVSVQLDRTLQTLGGKHVLKRNVISKYARSYLGSRVELSLILMREKQHILSQ
jgi:hypothetical protein